MLRRLRAALTHPAVFGLALILAIAIALMALFPPEAAQQLETTEIQAERGKAFIAPVNAPRFRLYSVRGTQAGQQPSGPLILFEDGVPQGPADTGHDLIRTEGSGAYSHWGRLLYFSTSDGSDPRSNGRTYAYRVGAMLKPKVAAIGAVLGLIGLLGFVHWARDPETSTAARTRVARAGAWIFAGALAIAGSFVLTKVSPPRAERSIDAAALAQVRDLASTDLRVLACCGSLLRVDEDSLTVRAGQLTLERAASAAALAAAAPAAPQFHVESGRLLVPTAFARATPTLRIATDLSPDPRLLIVAFLMALMALIAQTSARRPSHSPRRWFEPRPIAEHHAFGLALAFALGAIALLWWTWERGASTHLGVAGLLPVSDAMGYYRCALLAGESAGSAPDTAAHYGMTADWCGRRTIWPLALLSLLAATGWRAGTTLMLQAALIGAALGVVCHAAWRAYGIAAAALLGVLGAMFASQWALGNFMTEVYGYAAGLVGAALLIRHALTPSAALLASGLALVSVALAARAGALFVLPLLALWGYLTLRPASRWCSVRTAAVVIVASVAGGLLQWFGAMHFLGEWRNSGGNFAASLYGLSTGSRDWSQAYRDFAPLFAAGPETDAFAVIQRQAIANIQHNPWVFVDALQSAGAAFFRTMFAIADRVPLASLLTALLLVGVVSSLRRWREPRASLLLVVFAGEVMAAPFIIDSGGHRVFAATVWVRPLLAGVGILALLRLRPFAAAFSRDSSDPPGRADVPWITGAIAALLLAAPAAALLAPAGMLRPTTFREQVVCGGGEIGLLARVGRESMALTVAMRDEAPLEGPLLVKPGLVERDPSWRASWWSNQVGPMTAGTTLMLAFDAQHGARGHTVVLVAEQPLPPSADGIYRLCAGAETERALGDFKLRRLVSAEALNPTAH